MPGQKNPACATINGRLVAVTLTVSSGGEKLLAIRSLFPKIIPSTAPAVLHDASALLLLVLQDLQVSPAPINPKAFSFCDETLIYQLHQDQAKTLGELQTLALQLQSIDWEGSLDEAV